MSDWQVVVGEGLVSSLVCTACTGTGSAHNLVGSNVVGE